MLLRFLLRYQKQGLHCLFLILGMFPVFVYFNLNSLLKPKPQYAQVVARLLPFYQKPLNLCQAWKSWFKHTTLFGLASLIGLSLWIILIYHQAEGLIVVASLITACFSFLLHSRKTYHIQRVMQKLAFTEGIDRYKNKIVFGFIFVFFCLGIILLLVLAHAKLNSNQLVIESRSIVFFQLSLGWQPFVVKQLSGVGIDAIYKALNQFWPLTSFNGLIFLLAILTGLFYWWMGMPFVIFFLISGTYQPLVYVVLFHPTAIETIGSLFALGLGLILGLVASTFLMHFLLYKRQLNWSVLSWLNSFFFLISSFALWSDYYFSRSYEWLWWQIFLGIIIGLLISSTLVFWSIQQNWWFNKYQLKLVT